MEYPDPDKCISTIIPNVFLEICKELDANQTWRELNGKIDPRYALK